jgi:hypothetical protein
VYVRRDGNLEQRVLSPANGYVKGSAPRVFVTDTIPVPVPNYDRRLRLEREYYVPLDEVLRESMETSKKHLVAFVGTAIDHLQGRLELAVGETIPSKALPDSAGGD